MTHTVGSLLLAAGAAIILLDLVVAASTGHRSTLIWLRLHHVFPRLSGGLLVVLLSVAGAVVFIVGLDLLTRA